MLICFLITSLYMIVLEKCKYMKGLPTSHVKSFYVLKLFITFMEEKQNVCFLTSCFKDGYVDL